MTCSVAGLDRSRSDQTPLESSVEEMDGLGVSPTTFLSEEGDRYVSLQTECTPEQITQFAAYQDGLSDRIAAMPSAEIAQRLRDLYHAAYRYDPSARTVSVSDPGAERELNLWIGVINHRAFRDGDFLNRLSSERDIPLFLALNSPHLTPADRGVFFRQVREISTPREISEEMLPPLFDFLRTYDGRTPLLETPYLRSRMDLDAAFRLIYSPEELERLRAESVSPESTRQAVARAGYQEIYQRLEGLSDDVLLARAQDSVALLQNNPSPELQRSLAVDLMLADLVLSNRGRNYEEQLREAVAHDLTAGLGVTPSDAELLANLGNIRGTDSRLDDYQTRHTLLSHFRDLARELLTTPLTEERAHRYGLWSQLFLNRSITGVPVLLQDFARIRGEVRTELNFQTDGPVSWERFTTQDASRAHWYRPDELGTAEENVRGQRQGFTLMNSLTVDGGTLADYARDNVDLILVTPAGEHPVEHSAGLALLLFGVAVINGEEFHAQPGFEPSLGYFANVLTHEIGHHHFAASVFDTAPERLLWRAFDERCAFITGDRWSSEYVRRHLGRTRERTFLQRVHQRVDRALDLTNERLGLPEPDRSTDPADSRLEGHTLDFFGFYPTGTITPAGREVETSRQSFERLNPEERDQIWEAMLSLAGQSLTLSDEDTRLLGESIASLDALSDDQLSPTFAEAGDATPVLLRFINVFRTMLGGPPLPHGTFTGRVWREFRSELIGRLSASPGMIERIQNIQMAQYLIDSEFGSLPRDEARAFSDTFDHLRAMSDEEQISLPATDPMVQMVNRYYARAGIPPLPRLTVRGFSQFEEILFGLVDIHRYGRR